MLQSNCLVLMLLILCIHSFRSNGQQLMFKKHKDPQQTQFSYHFIDGHKQSHQLTFSVKNINIYQPFRRFRDFKPQRLQDYLLTELRKEISQLEPRKVMVELVPYADRFEIQVLAEDPQLNASVIQRLLDIKQHRKIQYLQEAYYNVLVNQQGQQGVKPDHVRFAKESITSLKGIVQAISQANPTLSSRGIVEYILAFIQAIPYSTLESRYESNGVGFNPPLRVINNNQGDCDSKVTLMAAMINGIFPETKVVIIYLAQHALIGVQFGHSNDDKWITLKDRDYILSEPTGPAMLPFGKIAKSSAHFIDTQQFTYEIF